MTIGPLKVNKPLPWWYTDPAISLLVLEENLLTLDRGAAGQHPNDGSLISPQTLHGLPQDGGIAAWVKVGCWGHSGDLLQYRKWSLVKLWYGMWLRLAVKFGHVVRVWL